METEAPPVERVEDPTEAAEPLVPPDPTERDRTGDGDMFRWSTWVHVGPGAEKCEDVDEAAGTTSCEDPLHFHAWCRLPNPFQHREIREKAQAAKARRARALRDPDSDAYAVLEDELDALARTGDAGKKDIVTELVAKDWYRDYLEAVRDVDEIEDEQTGEKVYGHILRDRQRWQELIALPASERPTEEFDALVEHMAAYEEAVDTKTREIQKPRQDALEAEDMGALIDRVRDQRIDGEAMEVFQHVYATWQMYLGTHRQKPRTSVDQTQLRFESREHMEGADASVIEALTEAFGDLERTMQQGKVPGN
jgi:hypothetical protein